MKWYNVLFHNNELKFVKMKQYLINTKTAY